MPPHIPAIPIISSGKNIIDEADFSMLHILLLEQEAEEEGNTSDEATFLTCSAC